MFIPLIRTSAQSYSSWLSRAVRISSMEFPATRLRRLRSTAAMRSLVRETHLHPGALIYPLFICEGEGVRREVSSMPGVFNLSIDEAVKEAEACAALGLGGLLLFGLPDTKGRAGQRRLRRRRHRPARPARHQEHIGREVARHHRRRLPLRVHLARPLRPSRRAATARRTTQIENDASVELLAKTAVSLAEAGADIVAPSDMMDGRVAAIRAALDAAGKHNIPILCYASKFASAFYGPFREAADSAPQFGDRRTYQMDGANLREAMREIEQDIAEGADMLLMKPAMPYLDVIREARQRFDLPMGAYQVSGEYSMLQAAFQRGWLEPERAMLESLLSIRRAGADFIVTYFAKEAAKALA